MAGRWYWTLVALTVLFCIVSTFIWRPAEAKPSNTTPLIEACRYGDFKLAKRLIREGADVNEKGLSGPSRVPGLEKSDVPTTPLASATEACSLLERLARRYPDSSYSPSFQASYKLVKLLCEQGANPNSANIMWGVAMDDAPKTLALLVEFKGDLTTKQNGQTLLHYYAEHIFGETRIPELYLPRAKNLFLILRNGCPVDATDKAGRTALHLASKSGNTAMIPILLAFGANPNAKDVGGLTPIDVAKTQEIYDILTGKVPFTQLPDRSAF